MQAKKPNQTRASRREEIAAAKLSELAAEAREDRDATALERLIVTGLTRYYYGIDKAVRSAPAAAEPPARVRSSLATPQPVARDTESRSLNWQAHPRVEVCHRRGRAARRRLS